MKKIIILGAGTWGVALANVLAGKSYQVTVWSKFPHEAEELNKTHHHKNLPGEINNNIVFVSDINKIKECEIVVFATPSVFIRQTASLVRDLVNDEQIFVTVAKGLEEGSLLTMSEVIKEEIGNDKKVVILSGPTHAEEVAIKMPTLIVASNKDEKVAEEIQEVFSTPYLRVYTNTDERGIELCGALKNIIALASGMSHGLGYGDNATAAIITRGLAEITRLGLAMGCEEKTFSGLTGIGDIVVTATSMHSRNFRAGILIGEGHSLKTTLQEIGMVVEGINALQGANELRIKYNVDMPIIEGIYNVIYKDEDIKDLMSKLFSRKQGNENI